MTQTSIGKSRREKDERNSDEVDGFQLFVFRSSDTRHAEMRKNQYEAHTVFARARKARRRTLIPG